MWRRFLLIVLGASASLMMLLQLAILAVDPLGISPIRLWKDDVLLEWSRRFMAPRIIRSGDYDSYIVGTSTLHHVDPDILNEALGGHFANVATHGAKPYEQRRMLELIFRQSSRPRQIVHGIDEFWCYANGPRYHPEAPLPEWLYEDSVLDHLAHSFNIRMLNLVFKRVRVALGLRQPMLAPSGYHNDLKDDAAWSREAVLTKLWGQTDPATFQPASLRPEETDNELPFPDVDALGDILKVRAGADVTLVLMPIHQSLMPSAGSDRARRLSTCKARLRDMAMTRGALLIDYMHASTFTRDETNFWDHDHTRVSFAYRLANDLTLAQQGRGSPDGSWIRLTEMQYDASRH